MPGPTGEEDPPLFVGALRFRGAGIRGWAGTNELQVDGVSGPPGWPAVLDADNHSGAFNPHIDSGQILGFGVEGSLPPSGTIRSSTDIEIRAAGGAELISAATMQLQTIGNIPIKFVTNTVERFEIQGDGAWQIGGVTGTDGQYTRSFGGAAPPQWATIDFGEITGGTWSDVLARGATSGANNPIVSAGQFMQFGAVGPTSLGAHIRSGDSPFIIHGGGQLNLIGTTNVAVAASGGAFVGSGSTNATMAASSGTATVQSTSGQVSLAAGTQIALTTASVSRIVYEADGSWNIGGSNGTAGQYIRSFGASAPPQWATITVADIPGIVATTGAVSIPAGGGASLFAGIRDNGAAEADRTNLNFVGGTNTTATVTDDAGNDELEVRFNVDDYPLAGLDDQAANTIVANPTAGSAAPTAVAVAADSVLARVGGNLVSHPWSTLFGTYLSYSAGVADWIGLDVRVNSGALTGTRHRLNVIGTSPVTVVGADDGANDEVDVTVSFDTAALLAAIDSTSIVVSGGTLQVAAASGGDITKAQNSNTYTVNNDAITYAKIQNVVNNNRFLGRISGVGGDVEEINGTQATSLLDNFTSTLKGLVPLSGGGTSNYLRADGSWVNPVFGLVGVTDGDKTDITVSSSGTVWTVDTNISKSWTGAHSFTGAVAFTVGVDSDVSVASTTGGLWLSAGHTPVVSPSVSNGDVLVNASNGLALNATATPSTNAAVGNVEVAADASVRFTTNGVERFEIEADGAWQLGGATGTAGQVVTSSGSAAPPTWQFPRKRRNCCEWSEEFFTVDTGVEPPIGLPGTNINFGAAEWIVTHNGAAGAASIAQINSEAGHPGVLRLGSGNVSGNTVTIMNGADGGFAWVRGDEVLEFEVVARLVNSATAGFFIGLSEDPRSMVITGVGNSNIIGFFFDTAGAFADTTIHCITREADGVAVNTDSNVAPSGWQVFTIRQTTLGTIEFLIDDVLVATHASQVPDTEAMNTGITVITRTAAAREIDVDYVSFTSHELDRTA